MSRRTNVRNWPSRSLSNRALLHTQEERLDAFGAFLFMGSVNAAQSGKRRPELFTSYFGARTLPARAYIPAETCRTIIPKLTELCRRDAVAYGSRACF
jgi:hypothetical protein